MKSQPRQFWSQELVLIKVERLNKNKIAVILGADEPTMLESEKALQKAKEIAFNKGFKLVDGMTDVLLFGQNALCQRKFFYTKKKAT